MIISCSKERTYFINFWGAYVYFAAMFNRKKRFVTLSSVTELIKFIVFVNRLKTGYSSLENHNLRD